MFRGAHSALGRRGREENGQKREGGLGGRRVGWGWGGDSGRTRSGGGQGRKRTEEAGVGEGEGRGEGAGRPMAMGFCSTETKGAIRFAACLQQQYRPGHTTSFSAT